MVALLLRDRTHTIHEIQRAPEILEVVRLLEMVPALDSPTLLELGRQPVERVSLQRFGATGARFTSPVG